MGHCHQLDACYTGRSCDVENVAQCKPTSAQGTVVDAGIKKAVDGTDEYTTIKCENSQQAPAFEVDLVKPHNISMVAVLVLDQDLNTEGQLTVELLAANNTLIATETHGENDLLFHFERIVHVAQKVRVTMRYGDGQCRDMSLIEVQVFSACGDGSTCITWEDCNAENVAECKPAWQSSTFDHGIARKGVDGNLELSHTKCEIEPWWEVELLDVYDVSEVIIYNRRDGSFDRLNGIVVELKDNDGRTVQSMQHDPLVDGIIEYAWSAKFTETALASKVRLVIQHEDHPDTECNYLNLEDVRVMTKCRDDQPYCQSWSDCSIGNVAQCKPAIQSTTGYFKMADGAVDGKETLSHTECETNPWWEVDLLSERAVREVVIHNREDCCFDRLNGLLIELFNEAGDMVASAQHDLARDGLIETMWMAQFHDNQGAQNGVRKVRTSIVAPPNECIFLNLAEVVSPRITDLAYSGFNVLFLTPLLFALFCAYRKS